MSKLKVDKKIELKNRYSFEAPIFQAYIPISKLANSPSQDYLDLNIYLSTKPGNTFLVAVKGESMIEENIQDGDILVIERTMKAQSGDIVIAAIDGEMTVKKLMLKEGRIYLLSANKHFYPIEILNFNNFEIQGIVRHIIKDI